MTYKNKSLELSIHLRIYKERVFLYSGKKLKKFDRYPNKKESESKRKRS